MLPGIFHQQLWPPEVGAPILQQSLRHRAVLSAAHPPTIPAGADASPAARPSASGVLGTASRPGSHRAATRAGLGAHGPQGMQELFLGLPERGERETTLIGDKLVRSARENRSGLPFLQGPDIGSAQAGSDIQFPQEFGDIHLQFGLMLVCSAKEVEGHYPNPVLGWGLLSIHRSRLGSRRGRCSLTAGTAGAGTAGSDTPTEGRKSKPCPVTTSLTSAWIFPYSFWASQM